MKSFVPSALLLGVEIYSPSEHMYVFETSGIATNQWGPEGGHKILGAHKISKNEKKQVIDHKK